MSSKKRREKRLNDVVYNQKMKEWHAKRVRFTKIINDPWLFEVNKV